MCLVDLNEEPIDETEEGIGYKVFSFSQPNLFSSSGLAFPIQGGQVFYDKWLVDHAKINIRISEDKTYQTGYHIFLNRADAECYRNSFMNHRNKIVLQVKYRKVVAKGQHICQIGNPFSARVPCVVAKEIFVPSVEKEHVEKEHKECV
jgi:hypothetical protein